MLEVVAQAIIYLDARMVKHMSESVAQAITSLCEASYSIHHMADILATYVCIDVVDELDVSEVAGPAVHHIYYVRSEAGDLSSARQVLYEVVV